LKYFHHTQPRYHLGLIIIPKITKNQIPKYHRKLRKADSQENCNSPETNWKVNNTSGQIARDEKSLVKRDNNIVFISYR